MRNLIWMRRRVLRPRAGPVVFDPPVCARMSLGILVFDSERVARLRFYSCAISDAWRGSLRQ